MDGKGQITRSSCSTVPSSNNSSWSQVAMPLSRAVRPCQRNTRSNSFRDFQAPEMSSQCNRSHSQSISAQKRTLGSWSGPGRDLGRFDGAGREVEVHGQRRKPGWREVVQGCRGSESSIVIAGKDTNLEALEEDDDGIIVLCPIKVGDSKRNRLCIMENNGVQNGEEEEVLELGCTDDSSDCSSTASGPTLPAVFTPQSLCEACAELFTNMRELKHWGTGIDYDPTSLSCDQWVLTKMRRPRTQSSTKGKLWECLGQIRKRALSIIESKEEQKPNTSCSRPRVFLHRKRETLGHRKPSQKSVKVGSRRSARWKRRKWCKKEVLTEAQLGVHCVSSSTDEDAANRACRKLDFIQGSVPPDPQRQSENLQSQNTTQKNIKLATRSLTSAARRRRRTVQPSPAGGVLDPCPWVQDGGFRSLLAVLEEPRNVVIKELDHLLVNK